MPEIDLVALLQGRLNVIEETRDDESIGGITLGEVTDVDDPLGMGRVKVKMHWLSDQVESAWARIAVPWAGSQMGAYFMPEVGDEAVIACRHGDPTHPYIIGFVWSSRTRPPEATPRLARRVLQSKSGHRLQFDDLTGVEAVALHSGKGHSIVLDDTPGASKITITDAAGKLSITLDSTSSAITIQAAAGDIKLSAPAGSISLEAGSIDITSLGDLSVTGGTVDIAGEPVSIN